MFFRKLIRKEGRHKYVYLKLVESVRERGKIKQKVLVNFGNITLWSKEKVKECINKLATITEVERPPFLEDVDPKNTYTYGPYLALDKIWNDLGLTKLINNLTSKFKAEFEIAKAIKAMVFNRLVDPKSKLSTYYWMRQQYIPDIGIRELKLQYYYRALDYIVEVKGGLEDNLFNKVTDLFNLDLSLVFYDVTSTYFQGYKCPIAKYGYSRDKRGDLEQIEIALLVNKEGIPLSHEVFEGNVYDSHTVKDVLEKMSKRFKIKRCIFVGDMGVNSSDVIEDLGRAGYEYITPVHRRNTLEGQRLMPLLSKRYKFRKVKNNLWVWELPLEGDVCYIAAYNPERAEEDNKRMEEILSFCERHIKTKGEFLAEGNKKIKTLESIDNFLKKKKCTEFFLRKEQEGKIIFERNEDRIKKEKMYHGMRVLKTNSTTLTSEEVALGYRTLYRVELAFREIKDLIRIRPIYHYAETRVRGHVLVCVLAYLLEILFEKYLRLSKNKISATEALDILEPLKIVVNELYGQRVLKTTTILPNQRHTLNSLGINNLSRIVSN